MEAIRSSKTSVNARSTQRHIPEDDILQRLRVFHKRMLREYLNLKGTVDDGGIFGCRREEVAGRRRKLHNEDTCNCPSSQNIIKPRRMRWAGHEARMEFTRNAYSTLARKTEWTI
jgi:hypothetical protein